ncbi:MAG: hypothetical protein RR554_00885 [Vagococcus sp.]|uniref:hypothetical protein n=1 Tax=Vagococcus sp. TaxID=1933889 RepID=UPI002FC8AE46
MNNSKRQLLELFKVNLLYANPQATSQLRKKGKYGNAIAKSLLLQQLMLGTVFTFIYGMSMFVIDFKVYPGLFTNYMGMFSILSFAQGVSVVYNVFFDSKDFEDYLPLPFTQKSIFLAKSLIVGFFLLPFMLPVISLFILTAFRSQLLLPLMIPFSLILAVLYLCLFISIIIYLVSFLVQTKVFQRFKTSLTILLMFIPSVGMVIGMMYMNQRQSEMFDSKAMPDQSVITILKPFHEMLTNPLSSYGLISLLGIIFCLLVMSYLIKRQILPKLSHQTASFKVSRKKVAYQGIKKQLIRYHFGLIKNPTLQIQVLTSVVIFPLIILLPMAFNGGINFSGLPYSYFIVFVVGGITFSFFTLSSNSLASVIISLDRSNLIFLKSLPISFKGYIKLKFNFAFLFQVILTTIVLVITSILIQLPILLMVALLFGNTLSCYAGTSFYLKKDSKTLSLNWTNINQLFSRGAGGFQIVVTILGTMFIGSILIIILVTWLNVSSHVLLINVVILAIVLILFIGYQLKINKTFWNEMKE